MKVVKMILLQLCILGCALLGPACWSATYFPDRYDAKIERASERYLPGVDWRLLKAQYYQESRLDPEAISPAGAAGLAQFMPGTWRDISRQLGYANLSPRIAEPAIEAGAYYMGKLRGAWSAPRPEADRHSLALASYNAGLGNLVQSQRLASGASDYAAIIKCLPDVTGRYSVETISYVQRIWGYWTQMLHVT